MNKEITLGKQFTGKEITLDENDVWYLIQFSKKFVKQIESFGNTRYLDDGDWDFFVKAGDDVDFKRIMKKVNPEVNSAYYWENESVADTCINEMLQFIKNNGGDSAKIMNQYHNFQRECKYQLKKINADRLDG
jgi:hypothetical protein